ncbi:unnamed protein product [Amoebophrya sp. A25]|nr:unnamed protein product [Amoebophrya sp. A25]|eukprot:GSA25T00019296001.1
MGRMARTAHPNRPQMGRMARSIAVTDCSVPFVPFDPCHPISGTLINCSSTIAKAEKVAPGQEQPEKHTSTSTISGMLAKVEKQREQQQLQRKEMQALLDKQTQATKRLQQELAVASQGAVEGQRQQLATVPTTTSPREVPVTSPGTSMARKMIGVQDIVPFLDWTKPEPPQSGVQSVSIATERRRDYAIFKYEARPQDQSVWPWERQLQLLNDEQIFVTLCRYDYNFQQDTSGVFPSPKDRFGVATAADFEEQTRGGKTSGQPSRHIRIGAFSRQHVLGGGGEFFGGASGAAVMAIKKWLANHSSVGDHLEFAIECETESKEWPLGSKAYEVYATIYVQFRKNIPEE